MGWCECMHDEYVEDPDPDKEDCKVEDDDPKDVCKDKPVGVEDGPGNPDDEQPRPDTDPTFPNVEPEEPDDDGPIEEDPVEVPVDIVPPCREGWVYDDDLDRCVNISCDPDSLDYDIEKCCAQGPGEGGYVDQLCRDICDPEYGGYDVDMCCDLESPWYDEERCKVEIEPDIEPEDPEDDGDPDEVETDPIEQPVVVDPGTVDVDELPPGAVSKCSSYINDGALEGLPDDASAEETKMFDLINAYRLSKGLSKWSWSPELHLACTAVGLFKLGAENTPAYESDYDKTRFGSLQELVMYYGYHNPVGPEFRYYKGPKPDADFIWGQTIDPVGRWGLKRALDALPGYVDCAVALVKNKSWVWMTAKGNECKEDDEEDPDEIDPNEVIDGGDELFDPAIVGTECDKNGPRYDTEWVWDETDKKCKGPGESKPEVEDPDEIDPNEVIDGGDEIFEPVTEIGTKCDPTNPEYDDTLEWDPDAKECRKKEGVEETVEPEPVDKPDTDIADELPPGVPATGTAGASLPPGEVNPIFGTECDQREGNDKYDPTFEWNQATKECKKRKEPEPEVEPEEIKPDTDPAFKPDEEKPGDVEVAPYTSYQEPPPVSWSSIPCYDDEGVVVTCPDDPDPFVDDNGDLDDDGVKDAEDPDDDNDGIDDTDDPRPDLPEPLVEPVVDPVPDSTPEETVVEFLGAKAVAKNVAFILDKSESMGWDINDYYEPKVAPIIPMHLRRWTLLSKQVERALNSLPLDAKVWVGFFSGWGSGDSSGWDPDYVYDWFIVGDPNRGREVFIDELKRIHLGGSTEPNNIISKCFKPSNLMPGVEPDVIYFLSDGGFTYKPSGQVKKHFLKKNFRDRAKVGKAPVTTHTFSIVDRGGGTEMQQIVGALNKAQGYPMWKGPHTYRHLTYGALVDMQDLPV